MKDCHISVGLKNACSTARAPGASRMMATRMPSTTIVLTDETTVAPVPPPPSSRGPRPAATKEPAGWPGETGEFASMRLPRTLLPPFRCRPASGLDGREVQVDAQVPLLKGGQRAVGPQARDGLVHAGHQLVALGEDQAVVLADGRELRDEHGRRVLQLEGRHVLRGRRVGDERVDPAGLKRRRGLRQGVEYLGLLGGLDV